MKRVIKFLFFGAITGYLIYILEMGASFGRISLPPLGKLMHPFEGYLQNGINPDKDISKNLLVSGILDEVTVVYDDRLVPHIYANNEHDLFFTQGYITAQHRLWQMDFQVRVAAGRLSEVIGPRTLFLDLSNRKKGLAWAAENSVKAFENDPVTKPILDAYTEGVNAYINSLEYKDYPIEFKLLNYQPEEWSTVKSALLLKYMADMLTGKATDIQLSNALSVLGENYMDLFYPEYNNGDSLLSPIIPKGTVFPPATKSPVIPPSVGLYNTFKDTGEAYIDGVGSNNWAVSGAKTASGKPILCNDPHLGLNLPCIWYEVQLNGAGYNTYGVSIPGSPAVIIGFNDSISWGVTNGTQDVLDYYKVKFKDNSKQEYLFDDKWMPTTMRIEEFKVKGKKTIYDTTYFTHYGPVVSNNSLTQNEVSSDLSIRWTGHDPSNELRTFIQLNKAKNYNDYENALGFFECPGQNFIFASVSGDIAIWQQGKFPVRFPKQGKYIMDGSKEIYQWHDYIPQQENPHIKNPLRNFVSSANQQPTDGTYPYYYYGRFEQYRNRRINSVLAAADSITIEDMMALQNDYYNVMAEDCLPFMLDAIKDSEVKPENQKFLNALKAWNLKNEPNSVGAAVFENWFDLFTNAIWDEFQSNTLWYQYPPDYAVVHVMKTFPNHPVFDNSYSKDKVETAQDLLRESFVSACVTLRNWETNNPNSQLSWAGVKSTSVEHMARISAFSFYDINIGGNSNIVNAASSKWGPSWRMIVSLEEEIKAFGVTPGGQSGNPASKYYATGLENWTIGKYFELKFWKTKTQALENRMSVEILNKK